MSNVIHGNFGKPETESAKPLKCSFCGEFEMDGVPMISNQEIHICGNCVNLCSSMIADTPVKLTGDFTKKTPSKIVEFVNQYVVGQDDAKKTLALAIYNHFKRIENNIPNGVEIQKSNILMIGPSGCGKTHLVQSIAKFLDIPLAISDATTLTESGYIGDDVESMLHSLIQNAGGDVKKAEHGIIFIDEVDKIAKRSAGTSLTKDPGGEGVQQSLLKLIEGTTATVPKTGGRKISGSQMDTIDTTNILFICGGAFVGLESILQKNHSTVTTGIGFGVEVEKKLPEKFSPEPEDLYQFGLIPELVGRLPVICTLDDLSVDALKKILVEPKNSIIKQFISLVNMEGVNLKFTEDAVQYIAEKANERKTGARGLRSIVEDIMKDSMFSLPDTPNVNSLLVEVVDGKAVVSPTFKKVAP